MEASLESAVSSAAGQASSSAAIGAASSSKRARSDDSAGAGAARGVAGANDAVTSLMGDGLDRGEAAAAAKAIADLAGATVAMAEQGALAITRLAEAGHAVAILNAGVMRPLLSALTAHPSSDPVLRSLCALLTKLADAGNLTADAPWLVEASCLLIQALAARSDDKQAAVNSCHALAVLAEHASLQLSSDTAMPFVTALGEGVAHEAVALAGCTAIRHLCEVPGNRRLLLAAGASAVLLSALQTHGNRRDVVAGACLALLRLFADVASSAEVDDARFAQALQAAISKHAGDALVERHAFAAVKQLLAARPSAVSRFANSGLAAAAVAALRREGASPLVQRSALAALAPLCAHAASADTLLAAGTATAVSSLLDETSDSSLAADCCLALKCLCEGATGFEHLRGSGAGAALVKALGKFVDDGNITHLACHALASLAQDGASISPLIAAGVIGSAVAVLQRRSELHDVPVSAQVCCLLHAICLDEGQRRALADAGAIAALAGAVRASCGSDAVNGPAGRALGLLCALAAEDDTICERLWDAAAHTALFAIMQSTEQLSLGCICCNAIGHMAADEMHARFIAREGALDATADMLHRMGLRNGNLVCSSLLVVDKLVAVIGEDVQLDVRSVGAALIDMLLSHRAAADRKVALSALLALRKITEHSAEFAQKEVQWLCSYGAGEAAIGALRKHCTGAHEAVAHDSKMAEAGCRLMSQLVHYGMSQLRLMRAGAAEALLHVLQVCASDDFVFDLACDLLDGLVWASPAPETGALADGTAFAMLVNGFANRVAAGKNVGDGFYAAGPLAALALDSAFIDAERAVQLAAPAGSGITVSAVAQLPEFSSALLFYRAASVQSRSASSGDSPLLHCLPGLANYSERVHANFAWKARHGSGSDVESAANAVASLQQSNFDCTMNVRLAASVGSQAAVDTLLNAAGDEVTLSALLTASACGHARLVDHLLHHWSADPTRADCLALILAAQFGRLEIAEQLLSADVEVSPAVEDCSPVWLAARNGHLDLVARLLSDSRADPSALRNAAIRMASRSGHLPVVQWLLADERLGVDPDASGHAALEAAAAGGHVDVLQALLADPRVDAGHYMQSEYDSSDDAGALQGEGLPRSTRLVLLRQPSVVRALVLPPLRPGDDASAEGGDAPAAPLRHAYRAADVHAWGAAAWRRRRHAVLAKLAPPLEE